MTTFIVAFGVVLVLFAAMAVGVIFANKPIKGSCGGLNALGMKEGCEICGGQDDVCEEEQRKAQNRKAASLGRDVLKS
jgi:hypothetical protein